MGTWERRSARRSLAPFWAERAVRRTAGRFTRLRQSGLCLGRGVVRRRSGLTETAPRPEQSGQSGQDQKTPHHLDHTQPPSETPTLAIIDRRRKPPLANSEQPSIPRLSANLHRPCKLPRLPLQWRNVRELSASRSEVLDVLILPAIDFRGGQCVRLRQGDYAQETVFGDDPAAMARRG